MPASAPLRVYPNPYASLDAEGNPDGVVRYDPTLGLPGVVHYVGARVAARWADRSAAPAGPLRPPPSVSRTNDGRFRRVAREAVFDGAPVEIPDSPYHRERVRDGSLVAADERSARACGVPFVAREVALDRAKGRACERFKAQTGVLPPWAKKSESVRAALDRSVAQGKEGAVEQKAEVK